jgi:hypothetical protein
MNEQTKSLQKPQFCSGYNLVVTADRGINDQFCNEGPSFYTKTLEDLYSSINNQIKQQIEEGVKFEDVKLTGNKFLTLESMGKKHTSEFMVLNVFNRYAILNSMLSLVDESIYHLFLKDNNFRRRLVTTGVCLVYNEENSKEEKKYDQISFTEYTFPTEIVEKKDINDKCSLESPVDIENLVFVWPGCGFILPKEVKTIFNPELRFPAFYVNDKKHEKTVGIYETNWGINVLQSELLCEINKIELEEKRSQGPIFLNNKSRESDSIGGYEIVINNEILNSPDLILELPLFSPQQDVLAKLTLKNHDETDDVPIFFTSCT